MQTAIAPAPPPLADEPCIGFLGVFTSPAAESAFRNQRFRDDRWLSCFLVAAGMLRVSLFLLADYGHFGVGSAFWLLFAARLVFLLVSAWVFSTLRRATSSAAGDGVLFAWNFLMIAMTACALAARPPSNNVLLLMSFGMILVSYCVMPLPLSRQALLGLTYSAAVLYASRHADGVIVATVGMVHVMSHLFGAVMSWRLNHRRRENFVGALQQGELRTRLEAALAEVRTLRGMLLICAWCKRVRDEAEAWESMEKYVQNHTHASFSHGICPDCFESQLNEAVRLSR